MAAPSSSATSERSSRGLVLVAAVSVAALLLLVVVGSVLEIGERLGRLHPVLAAVFYGAVVLVMVLGVVYPIVRIATQPVFSLYRLRDEQGHAKRWWCRRLVAGLERNPDLTPADAERLRASLEAGDTADDHLIAFFAERVVPSMDARTKRAARTAFCATAISQSPLVDAATVLSVSFNLVRELVDCCGFRPSNLALGRLYLRVMGAALIAGGLEDMDLEALLAGVLGGGTSGRVSGVVVASTAEGLVNAFLVFRVGCMVKGYLCAEDGPARMADLRRTSYKQALDLMRSTGFVSEMLRIVKDRAALVAQSAFSSVKDAATEAGFAARDTAVAAVASVGRAVRSNPLTRAFASKQAAKKPGLEDEPPDPAVPSL